MNWMYPNSKQYNNLLIMVYVFLILGLGFMHMVIYE